MYNRTIAYIFSLTLLFVLCLQTIWIIPVQAQDVVLSWEKPDDARVAGYRIFYGIKGSDYSCEVKETINSAEETTCHISGLDEGRIYVFAATSLDEYGNESAASVVEHTMPGPPVPAPEEPSSEDAGAPSGGGANPSTGETGTPCGGGANPSTRQVTAAPDSGGSGGCWITILSDRFKR